MHNVPLNAALQEKTSKAGKTYYVVAVQLTANFVKEFFLEPAELELVRLSFQAQNKKD